MNVNIMMKVPPLWVRLLLDDAEVSGAGPKAIPPGHRVPSYLARRFFQITNGIMSELWATQDLVPPHFAMLVSIDAQPGLDQKRLADILGIDRTNTGNFLDQLETMGLVERRLDPSDRRVRRLWLTALGAELRRRLQTPAIAAQDRILAALTEDEKVTLVRLLIRVIESNEAYARPGAGRRAPTSGRRKTVLVSAG